MRDHAFTSISLVLLFAAATMAAGVETPSDEVIPSFDFEEMVLVSAPGTATPTEKTTKTQKPQVTKLNEGIVAVQTSAKDPLRRLLEGGAPDSDPWQNVEVVPKLRDPIKENRHGGYAEKGEKHLAKALLRIKHNEEIAAKMAAHRVTKAMRERTGKAGRWHAERAVKKMTKRAKRAARHHQSARAKRRLKRTSRAKRAPALVKRAKKSPAQRKKARTDVRVMKKAKKSSPVKPRSGPVTRQRRVKTRSPALMKKSPALKKPKMSKRKLVKVEKRETKAYGARAERLLRPATQDEDEDEEGDGDGDNALIQTRKVRCHGKNCGPWVHSSEVVKELRDPVHEKRHGSQAERGEKHLAQHLLRLKRNAEVISKVKHHKKHHKAKKHKKHNKKVTRALKSKNTYRGKLGFEHKKKRTHKKKHKKHKKHKKLTRAQKIASLARRNQWDLKNSSRKKSKKKPRKRIGLVRPGRGLVVTHNHKKRSTHNNHHEDEDEEGGDGDGDGDDVQLIQAKSAHGVSSRRKGSYYRNKAAKDRRKAAYYRRKKSARARRKVKHYMRQAARDRKKASKFKKSNKFKKRNEQVLENIQSLFAFGAVAWAKNEDMQEMGDEHPARQSVVFDLVKALAKKSKTRNLIVRFADVFATARNQLSTVGVGAYILNNIHRAILKGEGVIHVTFNPVLEVYEAGLNHKVLGLMDQPKYMKALNVRLNKYTTAKHHIDTKGMLKSASLACLTAGKLRHYKSFYRQVLTTFASEKSKVVSKLRKGGFKGAKSAYRKFHKLVKQTHGGLKGAKAALKKMGGLVLVPSAKVLKREAKKLSAKWARKNAGCGSLARIASKRVRRL